ncbi:hypothetical protein H8S95_04020 [Pontibacter sp. KCTC 32443]|uniref:hypothetical protein n=1 Tax=Pontibacter TaxID=323449 RepID=UPI00164DB258|nr:MULTISPECIES: hypothetical protein [Pontibacter]MBC5773220.1 hypothetical protein [Pontibacter sp. KCTC 32443]
MILYNSEALSISLPVGNEWVCVECTKQPGYLNFKAGLMKALEYIRTNHINSWLFDFREIGELGEKEETWLQVQFFPQLMMLGQENYFAILVSESCYNRMLQEAGAYGLKSYNSFIIIDTFYQKKDAEDWLRSHTVSPQNS